MIKLKTLKELEKNMTFPNGYVLLNYSLNKDLRAEAIKWIKEFKNYNNLYPYPEELQYFTDSGFDEYASTRFPAVINFLKHFFNINDEDLK